MTSEGLPIISNKPYIAIHKDDLDIIPVKGDMIRVPADFFKPDTGTVWRRVENVPVTDDDWFIKVYLTNTKQSAPEEV